MNILVISQSDKVVVTGGQYVNQLVYATVREIGCSVSFSKELLDQKSNFRLMVSSVLNLKRIVDFDFVIVDSSLFPKLIVFSFLFSLFGQKRKLIILHHHFCSHLLHGIKGMVYRLMEYRFLKQSGSIVVFSPFVLSQLEKMKLSKKTFFVGLPFEKKETSDVGVRNKSLLYVGTIEKRKGLIYLIHALNLLPDYIRKDITLNVVGKVVSDSYFSHLKQEIKLLGLNANVVFWGRVDEKILDCLYNSSYAFVFPSLYEGYGMVVVEAMSHSLPVIVFNNTSMPYIVKNGENGLIVENENASEFANAIRLLYEDDCLYKKIKLGAEFTGAMAQSVDEFKSRTCENFKKILKIV